MILSFRLLEEINEAPSSFEGRPVQAQAIIPASQMTFMLNRCILFCFIVCAQACGANYAKKEYLDGNVQIDQHEGKSLLKLLFGPDYPNSQYR